ncbi:hypothetical protein DERP_000520 [Dermatophagoides pteronyssinus]|uniref:Gustatory receptor n=1 Tax=Dermatophagoides pteronyssinus TaxID=6956 RepID=A0ABQ8J0D4_DERPT|nr:hypothetical protein DERP_000520 [Dermatophagoides pteronyssinus]
MSESIEMKVAPVPDQPIGTDNKHSNELKNRSKNSAIILLDDVNKPQTSMDDKDRSSLNTEKLGISSSDGDDLEPIDMSINLYETILSIMIPYILVGCPFNYCFDRKKHSCVNSIFMKIYTFVISILVHAMVVFWLVRLMYNLFSRKHLTSESIEDIFIFSYLLAGVVGLDLIWFNRKRIDYVLHLLDINPIDKRCQTLLAHSCFRFKWNRWKFHLLTSISYVFAALLIFYYGYLIYSAIDIITDKDQNLELISWLLWSLKFRIIHLNLFIKNLIKIEDVPEIDDIEIIKSWFQSILKITRKIDDSFAFYLPVFIGFLFFGIIYFVSQTINIVKSGVNGESAQFLSTACLSFLMSLILFYGLKELSDIHQLSSMTKLILYDYVLDTKPQDRSTKFFEEINFVANGLLSNQATFTLLGQIELNRRFLAKLILIIYSYTVIFNQFERKIPSTTMSN